MRQWLQSLPSELAYGVITALVIAIGAWGYSRLRRDSEGTPSGEVRNVYEGPIFEVETIHELHVHGQAEVPKQPLPRHLPRGPLRFFNRKADLAGLDAVKAETETAPGPVVAVLHGMHGVGKSAIGYYWARKNRDAFPDGALFGDFSRRHRGMRVKPSDVLRDFLEELGTPEIAIPVDTADKRALFERVTSDRKMLVVLDDVEYAGQVLATLPTGPGSLVLVTSNDPLEELLREGAVPVPLEPLDEVMSREILVEMAGEDRLEAEPDSTHELIEICAGLPVALCVCGGKLAANPGRPVSWLAEQVTGAARLLEVFSPPGSYEVATVFEFAYRDLAPEAAHMYRRLGLHPGTEISAPAAAALAGLPSAAADVALDHLHHTHLLDMPSEGRYRPHQLIREHMRERVEVDDSNSQRESALRRLVDWYYAALRAADRAIVFDRLRLSDDVQVSATEVPTFDSEQDAFKWFDSERRNLMALLDCAYEREWDDRVWQIAETFWPLAANHKRFSEWMRSHELAIAASLRLGDREVEARMRSQLARAYSERGDLEKAAEEMRAATVAVEACDNRMLQASVVEFGGVCRLEAGDTRVALEAFERARSMFAACDSVRGVAIQDYHLGWASIEDGRPEQALAPLSKGQKTMEEVGDLVTLGRILLRRGEALTRLNRRSQAREALEEAVDTLDRIGIWFERAQAYEALAALAQADEDPTLARLHLQRAYRIYREFGHPRADLLLPALGEGS